MFTQDQNMFIEPYEASFARASVSVSIVSGTAITHKKKKPKKASSFPTKKFSQEKPPYHSPSKTPENRSQNRKHKKAPSFLLQIRRHRKIPPFSYTLISNNNISIK